MLPNSETTFAELEARASRLLEHAREIEPREAVRRYGSVLRLWHYPAYGSQTTWTILRPGRKSRGDARPRVREVTWERSFDAKRLFDPDEIRVKGLDSTPTIHLREAELPKPDLDALLQAASDLAVPVVLFSHSVGLDGEYFGLETYEVSPSVRMQWWGQGPIEWRHFTDWFGQLRSFLTAHLDVSPRAACVSRNVNPRSPEVRG